MPSCGIRRRPRHLRRRGPGHGLRKKIQNSAPANKRRPPVRGLSQGLSRAKGLSSPRPFPGRGQSLTRKPVAIIDGNSYNARTINGLFPTQRIRPSPRRRLAGSPHIPPAQEPVMTESVLDRLLRYVKIDTQSDENSETYPSTKKQFDLLNLLLGELKTLGLKDAAIDKYGYVTATLPGNLPASDRARGKVPVIGFI